MNNTPNDLNMFRGKKDHLFYNEIQEVWCYDSECSIWHPHFVYLYKSLIDFDFLLNSKNFPSD